MDNHSFGVLIACKYGLEESIIIQNIYYWIAKNKANRKHFYDGKYWTYNSIEAFSELFPYWTKRQIERIIKSAITQGALIKGNYNKVAYDRTSWYSVTETVKSIYANGEMDLRKQGNGFTQTVSPIPDINTDIKQIERESNASLSSPSSISPSIPLLSEEEKKEMDFLNSPKVEAKKEAVKGGEKILQTLSQAEMIFEKEIEDCQKTYFNSTNYQRAVETLCASSGLSQNKTKESAITDLKYCSVSFNEMLYSTGTTIKTMKDYASHFRNWLQKQDIQEVRERGSRIIHKIPLKENLRNGSNTGISPSVKRQMEAIFGTDPK